MASSIAENLKTLLEHNKITPYALEKKLKLTPNTIWNIVNGKSKKPSVYTIKLITDALGLNMDDLYSDHPISQEKLDIHKLNKVNTDNKKDPLINENLMKLCLEIFFVALNKHDKIIKKSKFFEIVNAIYDFSSGLENTVDKSSITRFTEWYIEKNI